MIAASVAMDEADSWRKVGKGVWMWMLRMWVKERIVY